ncbi:MAG: ClpXP protease specificity-enhancing factor SspB, partial [Gammaproteobacteria bacterium]|nr:ClpXP protease specificity-enhancing factor SspB [Gammaproteobacteria bacterium]
PMDIVLPQESIIAIYGRDSGEGMMFHLDEAELPDANGAPDIQADDRQPSLESVRDTGEDVDDGNDDGPDDDPGGKGKRGKPNLKIIK